MNPPGRPKGERRTPAGRRARARVGWRRRALLPWLGALPLGAVLAGCGFSGGQRTDFHLLRDPGAGVGAAAPAARSVKVLMLAAGATPTLYDTDRMVFSADGRSRSYFQFGYWSERPAQSILMLAQARLAEAQHFREVVLSSSGVRGELLLTLRLDELYLDATLDPGQVHLVLNAELLDWRNRKLLARRAFRQSAAATTNTHTGVAQAASQALGVLLGDLVDWAAASAALATG
jgi:cholesterol transport system auxiliary component